MKLRPYSNKGLEEPRTEKKKRCPEDQQWIKKRHAVTQVRGSCVDIAVLQLCSNWMFSMERHFIPRTMFIWVSKLEEKRRKRLR